MPKSKSIVQQFKRESINRQMDGLMDEQTEKYYQTLSPCFAVDKNILLGYWIIGKMRLFLGCASIWFPITNNHTIQNTEQQQQNILKLTILIVLTVLIYIISFKGLDRGFGYKIKKKSLYKHPSTPLPFTGLDRASNTTVKILSMAKSCPAKINYTAMQLLLQS